LPVINPVALIPAKSLYESDDITPVRANLMPSDPSPAEDFHAGYDFHRAANNIIVISCLCSLR
jgi:hypothetical protein